MFLRLLVRVSINSLVVAIMMESVSLSIES